MIAARVAVTKRIKKNFVSKKRGKGKKIEGRDGIVYKVYVTEKVHLVRYLPFHFSYPTDFLSVVHFFLL